jgi:hypothetical protein
LVVAPVAYLTGPQKLGTGGTLSVVGDRGHPPPSAWLETGATRHPQRGLEISPGPGPPAKQAAPEDGLRRVLARAVWQQDGEPFQKRFCRVLGLVDSAHHPKGAGRL